jgi:phosphatidylglycerophosphatase A
LAFGFGSGLAPKAPGTFGTLLAVPLYILLSQLSLLPYILVVVIAFAVGIYLCGRTATDLGVHDHPGIVWDEFVGFWITMIAAPAGWLWVFIGFILFRLFDIWKPWPIRFFDKNVESGLGIMIDDVLAGIYALMVLQLIALLT